MSEDFLKKLKRIADEKSRSRRAEIVHSGDHFWVERDDAESRAWKAIAERFRRIAYYMAGSKWFECKLGRFLLYKFAHIYLFALKKSRLSLY